MVGPRRQSSRDVDRAETNTREIEELGRKRRQVQKHKLAIASADDDRPIVFDLAPTVLVARNSFERNSVPLEAGEIVA